MTRPTGLPEWASTAGPSDLIEPSNAKKESGWRKILVGVDVIPEKPPYQEFNWWQNLVYQWIEKLADGTLSSNLYFVSKQGSNSNDGRAPDDSLLTITQALSLATGSDAVIVLDAGEYVENFTIDGKKVFAPYATVRGTVTFGAQGGTFSVYRHTGVNNTNMLVAGATNAAGFYEFCISEPNTSNCRNIVNNVDSFLNVNGGFLRAETEGITLAQDSQVRLSLRELMVGTETNGIRVNGNNARCDGVISLINRWPVGMTNSIGIYAERGRASLTVSRISLPANIKPYQIGEFGVLFLNCLDIVGDTPVVHPSGVFSTAVDLSSAQTLQNKTLVTPTIDDFTNAQHDHSDDENGGFISHLGLDNNVDTFGAIGDGVTDDTAAIQAALFSGASVVNFTGSKTYLVTDYLKINSNTIVDMQGATILRGSNINAIFLNNSDGLTGGYEANENITIKNGRIDANGITSAYSLGDFPTACTPIGIGHAKNILIENIEIFAVKQWHCIELNAVENGVIEKCWLHDCDLSPITAECIQFDYALNSSVFPWFGPYDKTACLNVRVSASLFENSAVGIGSHSSENGVLHVGVDINNNIFNDLSYEAIRCLNYSNVAIKSNKMTNTLKLAALATDEGSITVLTSSTSQIVSNFEIDGNIINTVGLGKAGGGVEGFGRGIYFKGTTLVAQNVIISNNIITDVARHGIGLDSIDGGVVCKNFVKECASTGIWGFRVQNVAFCANVTISNADVATRYDFALGQGGVALDGCSDVGNVFDTFANLASPIGAIHRRQQGDRVEENFSTGQVGEELFTQLASITLAAAAGIREIGISVTIPEDGWYTIDGSFRLNFGAAVTDPAILISTASGASSAWNPVLPLSRNTSGYTDRFAHSRGSVDTSVGGSITNIRAYFSKNQIIYLKAYTLNSVTITGGTGYISAFRHS